jgi:geranylgeranyl pyrophosphate synthase
VLVELLHAGSLIVDDIEDESAVRRGAPALHVEHGLARALNAGNWLYFWPQMLIARSRLPDALRLAIHERVATALMRCHQGQALDVSIDVRELAREETPGVVRAISRLKTGGLMELASARGALAARAEPRVVQALSDLGRDVGIGLQMLDDLSGYLSPSRAHKAAEDLRLHRPTWIWAWLAEGREPAEYDGALACLHAATSDEERARLLPHLRGVARAARPLVRAHFVEATHRVAQAVGESPTLAAVRRELDELEESYVSG